MKEVLKKITPIYYLYHRFLKLRSKIKDWLIIPSYETKRKIIINISGRYNCNEVFLETGTFLGDTVASLKNYFSKLISIELSKDLATKAQIRFQGESKIQIVQGDSAKQLSEILRLISTPVVFWLDGHYSSEFQAGSEYIVTGKGEKDTPVMEELMQISNHPIKDHLILIDDARLFNGENDYPAKEEIKNFVQKNLPGHSFSIKKDIIRILPTKIK
ncbi:MAG TPA: hypothetical protein VK483_01240 [Chitinophagaceae bacterium]|nr:hypothetical protein [Chitinophagaceae bacterium]